MINEITDLPWLRNASIWKLCTIKYIIRQPDVCATEVNDRFVRQVVKVIVTKINVDRDTSIRILVSSCLHETVMYNTTYQNYIKALNSN